MVVVGKEELHDIYRDHQRGDQDQPQEDVSSRYSADTPQHLTGRLHWVSFLFISIPQVCGDVEL